MIYIFQKFENYLRSSKIVTTLGNLSNIVKFLGCSIRCCRYMGEECPGWLYCTSAAAFLTSCRQSNLSPRSRATAARALLATSSQAEFSQGSVTLALERAEGAPKDPERVASSDHARESSRMQ